MFFILNILAWGDNNAFNASVDTEGFGNDEGFDSFLAMRAPPEVSYIILRKSKKKNIIFFSKGQNIQ